MNEPQEIVLRTTIDGNEIEARVMVERSAVINEDANSLVSRFIAPLNGLLVTAFPERGRRIVSDLIRERATP